MINVVFVIDDDRVYSGNISVYPEGENPDKSFFISVDANMFKDTDKALKLAQLCCDKLNKEVKG